MSLDVLARLVTLVLCHDTLCALARIAAGLPLAGRARTVDYRALANAMAFDAAPLLPNHRDAARAAMLEPVEPEPVLPALPTQLDYEPEADEHEYDPDCDCDLCRAAEVECPTCDGHGDVPTGRYSRANPTGCVTCTRCKGARYIRRHDLYLTTAAVA